MFVYLFSMFAAAGALQPLHSSNAESTSFLKSSWNKYTENYHPNYVLDNNPKTAWVEGVEGNGENERILIPISSVDKVRTVQIRIRNGYQKSAGLLQANGAPKDVTITLSSRNGSLVEEKKITLERKMGWQTIDIPVTSMDANIGIVQLSINSVHAGSKYKDTCISDIEIHVDSDSPYKPQVENHKQQQLKKWVKQRLDDAQYFANKPKEYPFAAVQFEHKKVSIAEPKFAAMYNEITALPKEAIWDAAYYTRENKTPLKVLPDLVRDLPKDIWRLSDLALFETKKQFAKKKIQELVDTESQYIPPSKHFLGNFKRAVSKDGTVLALSFVAQTEECERMCYSMKKEYTIHYSGDLVSKIIVVVDTEDESLDGNSQQIFLYAFRHDQGKIVGCSYYQKQQYQDVRQGADGNDELYDVYNYYAYDYTAVDKE